MSEERIVSGTTQGDDGRDKTLRPQRFDSFVGQSALIDNLKVFVSAARGRDEALDHVLLSGPPGLGKTTLAQIVSRELGVNFRSTSGPVIAKAGDLAAILTNLEPRDVLFIDEIHRLAPHVEELLYPAMEDFELDLIIGEGPSARTIKIDLSPFTLIGATTRAGLLATPLRDRFGVPARLNFYEVKDLTHIVARAARKLGADLSEDGAHEIAKRARGPPRVAGRLLRRVRDFAEAENAGQISAHFADLALKRLEVDTLGLDAQGRRYLYTLTEKVAGLPVGLDTLAASLSEARDALEEVIEPFLIQQGFIQRTPRGRMATPRAYEHLGIMEPPGLGNPEDLFGSDT